MLLIKKQVSFGHETDSDQISRENFNNLAKKNYADNCLKSLSRMSVRHLESLCSIFCSQLIDVTRKKVNLGR